MALPLLAIPGLIQAGVGLWQNIRGNQRAKNLKRPERTTPQAVQEAVAMSRYGAQAGQRPGSGQARENIASTQAATVSQVGKAGGSAAQTMAAAIGAQAQANRATQQQDVMDAQFRQQMNMEYLNQLQGLAREQAANWQWNEAQKFQEEADAARRLQEGGLQNLMGGIGEVAGMGFMNKMGYLNGAKTFADLFGGGKKNQALGERNQALQYLQQPQQNVASINMPQTQYQTPSIESVLPQLPQLQGLPTWGTGV